MSGRTSSSANPARAPERDRRRSGRVGVAHLPPRVRYTRTAADDRFLEDLSKRSFRFFRENADPTTGIVRDRARADGSPHKEDRRWVGSIAATGFALTALCIAAERGFIVNRWEEFSEAMIL